MSEAISSMAQWGAAGLVAMAFLAMPLMGEQWQQIIEERRLRRHTCPTPCQESRFCKCGCHDGMPGESTGTHCAVCGTPIVRDDEEYEGPYSSGEITAELPAPKGFTSWGWERDREFRKARRSGNE